MLSVSKLLRPNKGTGTRLKDFCVFTSWVHDEYNPSSKEAEWQFFLKEFFCLFFLFIGFFFLRFSCFFFFGFSFLRLKMHLALLADVVMNRLDLRGCHKMMSAYVKIVRNYKRNDGKEINLWKGRFCKVRTQFTERAIGGLRTENPFVRINNNSFH